MRPRANQLSLSLRAIELLCGVVLLLGLSASVFASPPGRIVVRNEMRVAHRTVLLEKLRSITGLRQLTFDRSGALVLGQIEGPGSSSARELLARAVHGAKSVVIEEASNRADVAFCSLVIRGSGDSSQEALYIVRIDFQDFRYIIGDQKARASFNVGWGFLHELDHVVSESEDTGVASATGECEENINKMRLELGLPLRATYRFSPIPAPADPAFITRLVRLGFVQRDPRGKRVKQYWLVWDASLIGGSEARRELASIH